MFSATLNCGTSASSWCTKLIPSACASRGPSRRTGRLLPQHFSRIRPHHAAHDVHQGRFAGAVLPHQRVHLAPSHVEGNRVQHPDPAERFRDVAHLQQRDGLIHVVTPRSKYSSWLWFSQTLQVMRQDQPARYEHHHRRNQRYAPQAVLFLRLREARHGGSDASCGAGIPPARAGPQERFPRPALVEALESVLPPVAWNAPSAPQPAGRSVRYPKQSRAGLYRRPPVAAAVRQSRGPFRPSRRAVAAPSVPIARSPWPPGAAPRRGRFPPASAPPPLPPPPRSVPPTRSPTPPRELPPATSPVRITICATASPNSRFSEIICPSSAFRSPVTFCATAWS